MDNTKLSVQNQLKLFKAHINKLENQKTRKTIAAFSMQSIWKVVPGSFVVLTRYNNDGTTTEVAGFAGEESDEKVFGKFFEKHLKGKQLKLILKPQEQKQVSLNKLPVNFHILTGKQVSEEECLKVEKKLKFKVCYVSQLGVEKKLFGSVLIFIKEESLPVSPTIVELYTTLMSFALSRKAIEESFYENEKKLQAIIEDQTEFIIRWNADGTINFVNESCSKHLGLSKEDILGSNFYSFINPGDVDRVTAKINALSKDHSVATDIHRVQRKDGSWAWHEWTDRAILNNNNEIVEYQSVGHDITKLMNISEELKKSETKYRSSNEILTNILDAIPVRVFWKDKDSRYMGSNRLFAEDAGMESPRELIGKTDYDLSWNDIAGQHIINDKWVLNTGLSKLNYHEQLETQSKGNRSIRKSLVPLRNDQGFYGVLGVYDDITRQREMDEAFRLQNLINELRANIWKLATKDNIESIEWLVNEVVHITGKTLEVDRMSYLQMNKNRTSYKVVHQYFDAACSDTMKASLSASVISAMPEGDFIELPEMFNAITDDRILNSKSFSKTKNEFNKQNLKNYLVLRMGHKKTAEKLLSLSRCKNPKPWTKAEKNLLKEIAELINLKESQIRAREEVSRSEKKYKDIYNNILDGICILDRDFCFTDVNPGFEKISGYSLEELKEKHAVDLVVDEDKKKTREYFREVVKKGDFKHFEVKITTSEGEIRQLEINTTAIKDRDGLFIGTRHIIRDVTYRMRKNRLINDIQEGVSANYGETFLERITFYLWKVLEADFVFVAEPEEKGSLKINTLAVCQDGKAVENFSYILDGTPCESIIKKQEYVYFSKVRDRFPAVELLSQMKASDFIGIPLFDSGNNVMGILAGVYKKPIKDPELLKYVMKIFATRIGAEIERMHKEKVIVDARKKAEQSDKLKSAFLANMSHEIRTPMNAIVGFSELLAEPDMTEEEKQNFINIIRSNSSKLLNLITDIIDIAKIEAGEISIEKNNFSVNDLIKEIKDIFEREKNNLGKEHIEVRCNIPANADVLLNSDQFRVNQILTNLVGNALKFTYKGSVEIGYTIEDEQKEIHFYVKDTGKGIGKSDQEKIFERFMQLDNTREKTAGTGLGLSISINLAKLLGGKMKLDSQPGIGSTFTLMLPLDVLENQFKQADKTVAVRDKKLLKKKNILIAEDELSNFELLKIILEKKGLNVQHAYNGKEAFEMLNSGQYDLLLCDLKMPVMDGYETLEHIKKSGLKIPVVALTAYAMSEEIDKANKAGFHDYVTKPIRQQQILDVITKYL